MINKSTDKTLLGFFLQPFFFQRLFSALAESKLALISARAKRRTPSQVSFMTWLWKSSFPGILFFLLED